MALGLRSTICAALLLAPLGSLSAQNPAVTIDNESKHHLVLSNDWVRVFDVIVPPGDSTLYHVHQKDYVFVTFGAVSLKSQVQGAEKVDLALKDGDVRMTAAPIAHRVLNPSAVPFHNLTIELLRTAGAPLPPADPSMVVLDNNRVRVQRIVLEPGESTLQHAHSGPGLEVALTSGSVRIVGSDGSQERWTFTPAQYKWRGGPRAHTVANTGAAPIELLEIEWK